VIDFRYHLVSIVAVFLALAIGIVLGSTELQGPVYSALDNTSAKLKGDLDTEGGQLNAANALAAADNSFIQANEAVLLNDRLAGQRIALFTEPGASSAVINGITTAAKDAGATVTVTVNLQAKFFGSSDSTAATLETINSDVAQHAGIQMDSGVADTQQGTALVIANQLLVKASTQESPNSTASASTWQASDAQTALGAYQQDDFLTVDGTPTEPATLAVIVTTNTIPSDGTADPLAQVLGPFAEGLANVTTTAVAGAAGTSGAGSPMAVLRQTNASSLVSSVDDADSARGQIALIEALYSQLNGGTPGSWGINSGDSYPTITPSASATPTPTATPATKKKKSGK
jgi:Copper transport outer membrane protein, MctB